MGNDRLTDKAATAPEEQQRREFPLQPRQPAFEPFVQEVWSNPKSFADDKRKMETPDRQPPSGEQQERERERQLLDRLSKVTVPQALSTIGDLNLTPPPGLNVRVDGHDEAHVSLAAMLQAGREGKLSLPIKPGTPEASSDIGRVMSWVEDSKKLTHDVLSERAVRAMSDYVDDEIAAGRLDSGWRRPTNMDGATWMSALTQTENFYNRFANVCKSIDLLTRAGVGFESDALENLPPGLSLVRDPKTGSLTNVSFGDRMIPDLKLSSDSNQPRIQPLDAWLAKYEKDGTRALRELGGDPLHMAGFGEAQIPFGWVNGKGEWESSKHAPNEEWKKFNLIKFDTKVDCKRDEQGELTEVSVTPDIHFVDVPSIGYLNKVYTESHVPDQKTRVYKPNDPVIVQTGPEPENREIVTAKDLPSWLAWQRAKKTAADAITVAMDAGVAAEGILGLVAKRSMAKIGVEEAVSVALKREAPTEVKALAAEITKRQTTSSLIKIGVAATAGIQGNNENPPLDAISSMRNKYFLGMGITPFFDNSFVRTGRDLAKATLPKLSRDVAAASEMVRGTDAVNEYAKLAEAGGLIKALRYGKELQQGVHATLGGAELAFWGQAVVETSDMRAHSKVRPQDMNSARITASKAESLDQTAVQKLITFGTTRDAIPETHLHSFREGLGKLSEPQAKQIDQIVSKTSHLMTEQTTDADRKNYLASLMDYFHFSGDQIKSLYEKQNGPVAADQLDKLATRNTELFDPKVRLMAGVAILALSKQADGSLPEIAASRETQVPSYSVLRIIGEQAVVEKRAASTVTQQLSSEQLMGMLSADLHGTSDRRVRQAKTAALYDLGLVSGEQYGSLLLSELQQPKALRSEAKETSVLELGRVISRLSIEEKIREVALNPDQLSAARGLTAGLSSVDLKRDLSKVAENSNSELKATSDFVLRFLNKQHIDDTDKERFNRFFNDSRKGVTAQEDESLERADLISTPKTASEWERKMQAVEYFANSATANSDEATRKEIIAAYKACLAGPNPSTAVIGLARFGKTLAESGRSAENELLQSSMVMASVKALNDRLADDPQQELSVRGEMAMERVRLIEALGTVPASQRSAAYRQSLLGIIDRSGDADRFEEVRIAALKGLGSCAKREDATVIKHSADLSHEPSAAVRLQAVDTLERLSLPASEQRTMLGDLANRETDIAVSLRLAKHYRPEGKLLDADSQVSRQELADTITEQNRDSAKFNDVEKLINQRLKKSDSIFEYFDAERATIPTMLGSNSLMSMWRAQREIVDARSFTTDLQKQFANAELVQLEARMQERAFQTYQQGVTNLAKEALAGDTRKNIPFGDRVIDAREASILALGNLVSGGSRMGKPFYQHRMDYEPSAAHPTHQAFSRKQIELRAEIDPALRDSVVARPAYGWDGKQLNVRTFSKDPWTETELKIAKHLADLTTKAPAHLGTLTEQLLKGLGKESSATDESRAVLVSGLDRVLARKDLNYEARKHIMSEVTNLIGRDGLSAKENPKSTIAMLGLVNRYAERVFDSQSDDWAKLRIAVDSRRDVRSYNTPASVRTAAHQVFNRLWDGCLEKYNRTVPAGGTERQKAELLPTNTGILRSGTPSNETVEDAVDRIFLATKGDKISGTDARFNALQELSAEGIHEKVRLAASLALLQSGNEGSISALLDIAINSNNSACRQDALAALTRVPNAVRIDAHVLDGVRSKLIVELSRATSSAESLQQLSDRALIERAKKVESVTVQSALRKLGSALMTVGSLESVMPQQNDKTALIHLRDGLEAANVDSRSDALKIMQEQSLRGDLPLVVDALNAFGTIYGNHANGFANPAATRSKSQAMLSLATSLRTQFLTQ